MKGLVCDLTDEGKRKGGEQIKGKGGREREANWSKCGTGPTARRSEVQAVVNNRRRAGKWKEE